MKNLKKKLYILYQNDNDNDYTKGVQMYVCVKHEYCQSIWMCIYVWVCPN